MKTVPIVVKTLGSLVLGLSLTAVGCHAQLPASASAKLSAETARRVEVLIRSKSSVPPNYTVTIGPRTASEIPGFDRILVTFSSDGKDSKPAPFLLSTDGKTLAQFNSFDIGKDPRGLVPDANRPARGGPESAPVLIVGFDDLECPFCARMHQQLFPALLDRYGDRIHLVYRDYPLPNHPWAMRAAIDTNCVGAQSGPGYWQLVDYIHAHAGELGGPEKSLARANEALDTLSADEGKRQKVDAETLKACIAKQDDTAIKASIQLGESLGIEGTPALYVNGEKIDGAVPLTAVYRAVDSALLAAGQTPPPPASAPTQPSPSKAGN